MKALAIVALAVSCVVGGWFAAWWVIEIMFGRAPK